MLEQSGMALQMVKMQLQYFYYYSLYIFVHATKYHKFAGLGLTFNLWQRNSCLNNLFTVNPPPPTLKKRKEKKKTTLIQPLNMIFSFWYSHQEENNFRLLKASTEVEKRKQLSHLHAYNVKSI